MTAAKSDPCVDVAVRKIRKRGRGVNAHIDIRVFLIEITQTRNAVKAKTKELLTLQPALTDMDPFVVKLLL